MTTESKKPPAEKAGVTVGKDWAQLVTEPTPYKLGAIEDLLKDRGLDPNDWIVEHTKVNDWQAYAGRDTEDGEPRIITLHQLKVNLKRRVAIDWLFPAVEVAERFRPGRTTRRKKSAKLAVICGDQQAPYHDEDLHLAFCNWLADVKPDFGALTGDTCDFPTISRYGDRPHWNASPQECLNSGFKLLSDYRDAAAVTSWRKLRGNHDIRIESELISKTERLFGLTPAEIPGEEQLPGYSIRRLLHLDRLGIELVGREGDKWQLAEFELVPETGIYVRHQPPTAKTLTRLHRTVVAGHTHRQSVKQMTVWQGDTPHVITLVETGTLSRIDGLGYTDHPDWQQGFVTVSIDADGNLGFDLATWQNRVLTWRGQSWTP